MKAFLAVLVLSIGCLRAETFEHVTHSFPLGTEKEDLLAKEPSATVIPCLVRPIDSARLTECRVVMRRDSEGALMTQFYLVDGRIAAISLARKSFPGTPFDSRADTEYLRNNQKLATF